MFPSAYPRSSGSRIDVTTLTPFTTDVSGATPTGSFQTILSINGKGVLESFYAYQSTNTAGFQIRVTVDGVVKVLLGNANLNNTIGVVNKSDIVDYSAQGQSGIRQPTSVTFAGQTTLGFKPYPTTDGSGGIILLGDQRIFFYSSLLLEITAGTASSNAISYHYAGGYK